MNLPFVSRARFEDQRAELERLRGELQRSTEAREKLWNFLVWRVGGVAVDVSALPEAYQPKPVQPVAACDTTKVTGKPTTHDVRSTLAEFEVKREGEYLEKAGVPRRPIAVPPEQIEVIAALNKTANEVAS